MVSVLQVGRPGKHQPGAAYHKHFLDREEHAHHKRKIPISAAPRKRELRNKQDDSVEVYRNMRTLGLDDIHIYTEEGLIKLI